MDKEDELLNVIANLDESTIKKMNEIIKLRNKIAHEVALSEKQKALGDTKLKQEKRRLIGIIPSLLLNKQYFPTNELISQFATKNLGLAIPGVAKKSREEIMGRIIAEIDKQEEDTINRLIKVLDEILGKEEKGEVKDFFLEWDKAIRVVK